MNSEAVLMMAMASACRGRPRSAHAALADTLAASTTVTTTSGESVRVYSLKPQFQWLARAV